MRSLTHLAVPSRLSIERCCWVWVGLWLATTILISTGCTPTVKRDKSLTSTDLAHSRPNRLGQTPVATAQIPQASSSHDERPGFAGAPSSACDPDAQEGAAGTIWDEPDSLTDAFAKLDQAVNQSASDIARLAPAENPAAARDVTVQETRPDQTSTGQPVAGPGVQFAQPRPLPMMQHRGGWSAATLIHPSRQSF